MVCSPRRFSKPRWAALPGSFLEMQTTTPHAGPTEWGTLPLRMTRMLSQAWGPSAPCPPLSRAPPINQFPMGLWAGNDPGRGGPGDNIRTRGPFS